MTETRHNASVFSELLRAGLEHCRFRISDLIILLETTFEIAFLVAAQSRRGKGQVQRA